MSTTRTTETASEASQTGRRKPTEAGRFGQRARSLDQATALREARSARSVSGEWTLGAFFCRFLTVAVLPADQPRLLRGAISLAVRAWLRERPPRLTLAYHCEPCHPLIASAALLGDLHVLHGEKAWWRMFEQLGDAVQRVEVDHSVSSDIDTWEDYLRLSAP